MPQELLPGQVEPLMQYSGELPSGAEQIQYLMKLHFGKMMDAGIEPDIKEAFRQARIGLHTNGAAYYGLPPTNEDGLLTLARAMKEEGDLIPIEPTQPSVSFAELLAPYYGNKVDQELNSAFSYNDKQFPANSSGARPDIPSSFPTKALQNFTPDKVDGGVPLNKNGSKTGYDTLSDSINLQRTATESDLEQAVGQATYGNKINREMGNYEDPNELLVGLGQAQRQHYKAFGSRMDQNKLGSFLDKNDFSIFDDNTTRALQQLDKLRKSTNPEEQKRFQDSMQILPGLVSNEHPTAKQLFG